MRVIYTFRVDAQRAAEFESAWAEVTRTIRAHVPGARGSLLLRRSETEYVAVARWTDRAAWERHRADPPPAVLADLPARAALRAASELLSAEPLDEVEDVTDAGGG